MENPGLRKRTGIFFLNILLSILESGLKTDYFGLKPANSQIFNNPELKVGVIDVAVNKGFSPNIRFFHAFLDWAHSINQPINKKITAIPISMKGFGAMEPVVHLEF